MGKRKAVEKLIKAKEKLQKQGHKSSCPVDIDPEGFAPCNCGASAASSAADLIEDALKELFDE